MKIKYGDYRNKADFLEKECVKLNIEHENFDITAYLVYVKKAAKPWFVPREKGEECNLDDNYKWLQLYGIEKNAVITAIFDDKNNFVETYFDICRNTFIEEDVPYAEDLYLDVVQTKEGDFIILDEDELEDAYRINDITEKEFELAKNVCKNIIDKYGKTNNLENIEKYCLEKCLKRLIY